MRAGKPTSTRQRSPSSFCGHPRAGALVTIDRNTGHPFASLVNVATDVYAPSILISRLRHLIPQIWKRTSRASLLLMFIGRGDPLAHPRLTVLGDFVPIGRQDPSEPRLRRRFLARHPKSEIYAGFADFSFWKNGGCFGSSRCRLRVRRSAKASDVITDAAGRGKSDRGRSRRDRAHEPGSFRSATALREQASWCRGWALASHRARSGMLRPLLERCDAASAVSAAGRYCG